MKKFSFNTQQKKQISDAVKDAEKVTCGEIVPFIVPSSDPYSEASWYSASILGAVAALLVGALSYHWMLPFQVTPFEVAVFILGSLILGFILPLVLPVLRRMIIADDQKNHRVRQRARQAFLEEKVFQTEERVGILIFISMFERKVLVLGDEGINAKVKEEDWKEIVAALIEGIKKNQTTDGLVKAIGLGKDLLLKHGFVRKDTDFNELHDELRLGD